MNSKRENNFSFLHWMGLVFVIMGHQYNLLGQASPTVLNVEYHYLGVRILFVVSGYLVTESYKRTKDNCKFIKKRLLRILPGLAIATLGILLIMCLFTVVPLKEYMQGVPRYLYNIALYPIFNMPGVFINNPYPVTINGSLWTLPVEVFCYLLLPVMGVSVDKLQKKCKRIADVFVILMIIISYAVYMIVELGIWNQRIIFWGTNWTMACQIIVYFVLGSSISYFNISSKFDLQLVIPLIVVYMMVPSIVATAIRPFVVSYFVMSFAFNTPATLGKVFEKFNWYYAGYLWSFPIQQCVIDVILVRKGVYVHPFMFFMISFTIIFITAWFVTKYLEEPIVKKLNVLL